MAECSASLESEMLFLSVLGVLGAVSLPAETLERVVVLVALLRRRKRGRNRRDLILLIPASSRWPCACSREKWDSKAVVDQMYLLLGQYQPWSLRVVLSLLPC